MKVVIDADRCTGHGRCYTLAPEVFDADDRGLGVVKGTGEVGAELEATARRAVANCPEQAIAVID